MSNFLSQQAIILASGSAIRYKLLSTLGIDFSVVPSTCDEAVIKENFQSDDVIGLGHLLAQSKALEVSQRHPGKFIIAADQLCVIGDRVLDKPLNHATAVEHLRLLRGQTHQQIACLCIAQAGNILWQFQDIANLTMHDLDNATIEAYLQCEQPYQSCGAYQYETQGKWLFKTVQGREDTILGLPLLPLVEALLQLHAVHL